MKLTIFCGKDKPLKAIGKNQCNLLEFAFKYPGWHTFTNKSKVAINRLKDKGYIQVIGDQFKLI